MAQQHYFISKDGSQILSFKKEKDARAMVALNEGSHYTNDTDGSRGELPMAILVELHNKIRPEKPVKKFADRETAVKRTKGVLELLATPGTASEAPAVVGKITPEGGAETTAPATKGRGHPRASGDKYANVVIVRLTETNPRKEGTSGWKSWNLLKNNMTVKEFLLAGGVKRDLEWDITKGFTKVVERAKVDSSIQPAEKTGTE
jgi:hypothetical protein